MTKEIEKRNIIDRLRAEMTRQGGRHYLIELEVLDVKSLRELQRLLSDLHAETRRTAQRTRIFPW